MHKVNWFILFGLFVFSQVNCQLSVEAKVIDATSQEPLPFANVSTADGHGTITNTEGEFLLNVDTLDANITISFIGYKKTTLRISDVSSVIPIEPDLIELKEVIVTNVDIDKMIESFISKAKKEEKRNGNVLNTYFYRQSTYTDGTCNELIESFINAYPFNSLRNLDLITGRYAKLLSDSINGYVEQTNFFHNIQISPVHIKKPKKDMVITPFQPGFKDYYSVTATSFQNEGEILCELSFEPKKIVSRPIVKATIVIKTKELQLKKIKGEILNMYYSTDYGNVEIVDSHLGFEVFYVEKENHSVVQSAHIESDFVVVTPDSNKKVHISSILYNTDQITFSSINKKNKLKFNSSLLGKIQGQGYDESFWVNMPIVKRTPLEEESTSIFEKNNLFGTFDNKQ
jgi:hypothetical protein